MKTLESVCISFFRLFFVVGMQRDQRGDSFRSHRYLYIYHHLCLGFFKSFTPFLRQNPDYQVTQLLPIISASQRIVAKFSPFPGGFFLPPLSRLYTRKPLWQLRLKLAFFSLFLSYFFLPFRFARSPEDPLWWVRAGGGVAPPSATGEGKVVHPEVDEGLRRGGG